jgi:uncharacterized protein YoxC
MENQLHEIEMTIEDAQRSIDEMQSLDRLRDSKDWKNLIEVGYLEKEAARLVLAKADPGLQDDNNQKQLDKMIDAVGYFRQYLNKIYQFGHHAERAIHDHRQTRDEIQQEMVING